MSIEVAIWRIDEGRHPVSLDGMDYEQRLQDIIAADLSIVDPSLMVIGREVPTSFGGRIDLLAIDAVGNLIVVELKRGQTPREVVAQTLDYGSWVRHLNSEEIADVFISYQRRFLNEETPEGINDALQRKFNTIPDELNTSHRLVIVAGELDPSTQRIVLYLQEEYSVDINVVVFRAFQDDDRLYLTRTWLSEPALLSTDESPRAISRGEWNGEYYVSFGEGPHRRWNDAKRYGFVSAGGGAWYVRTLRMLQRGSRVWVSVPGRGYVGVGEVVTSVERYDQFRVDVNGTLTPLTEVEVEAPDVFDEAHGEHFVGVRWIKVVNLEDAVRERGFFGNQNTVAQPRSSKWHFTVERLKVLWGVN